MKLKLDENLSRHLKPVLASLGHDVATAHEEGLLAKKDFEVFAVAKAEGRMLFTLDLHLADLRKYPPGAHPGIVLFRPEPPWPLVTMRFVERFARAHDLRSFTGCLVVVDPGRVRVRAPAKRLAGR
jgi:predicted nuclease of predicted toxin-antitoxin system